VSFSTAGHWVWDFWVADDGDRFHLFYLHAPTSLGDPDLRHRNARIGHATSVDLVEWHDHGVVLEPGRPGEIDASATWTGSVVRGDDGDWRMFYTGSVFLSSSEITNIETVGVAVSQDLETWTKVPSLRLQADPAWYEVLSDRTWHEEAWRDPWVFRDPAGDGWHMLLTARSRRPGASRDYGARDRGVVGHARSTDLAEWTIQPPLSRPGAGFAHIEVPQAVQLDGRDWLVFSCDSLHLAGARSGGVGGIWIAPASSPVGAFDVEAAELLLDERYYAGRVVMGRDGRPRLLAFENATGEHGFAGRVTDPFLIDTDGDAPVVAGITITEGNS
jgi:beta-fructofuranosidase